MAILLNVYIVYETLTIYANQELKLVHLTFITSVSLGELL